MYTEVYEPLRASASVINVLIRSSFPEASSVQLVQVRRGRQMALPWLAALMHVGLP